MSQVPVSIGGSSNDGTGDTLRAAFAKVNANDVDLDSRINALAQLVCTPPILTALVAALPRTLPTTAGQLWVNGNVVQIS